MERIKQVTPSAIFLDRDGVIVESVTSYVKSLNDVRFIPYSRSAIRILNSSFPNAKIYIVTNQGGIEKGYLTLEEFGFINNYIVQGIAQYNGYIYKTLACPHSKEAGCSCRKPNIGLFNLVKDEIDLSNSWMIGDYHTDILAGLRAGCQCIQVMTGRYREDNIKYSIRNTCLFTAVKRIVEEYDFK